jgi:hypothetical protein
LFPVDHLKEFKIPPSTGIRYPTIPCSPGGTPVVIEVKAAAVVLGATVVIEFPENSDKDVKISLLSWNWCQPNPSRTRSTTVFAKKISSEKHEGGFELPKRAGTNLFTQQSE